MVHAAQQQYSTLGCCIKKLLFFGWMMDHAWTLQCMKIWFDSIVYIMYMYVCLWTTSWHQFKSDCHQTLSVIPLATGDEVIKILERQRSRLVGRYVLYWTPNFRTSKVKVGGEVCALLNALLVCYVFILFSQHLFTVAIKEEEIAKWNLLTFIEFVGAQNTAFSSVRSIDEASSVYVCDW